MARVSETPAGVAFGRFRLEPHRRQLLADGQPIKLGGRAFDVLMALIKARGGVWRTLGRSSIAERHPWISVAQHLSVSPFWV